MPNEYLKTGAAISDCGTYRYTLTRRWAEGAPFRALIVVGLNPSTADAEQDDPTIRRCVAFAQREGCGGLVMLNLFALRATDPRMMLAHPDPVGPLNDWTLNYWLSDPSAIAVAAWGVYGAHRGQAAKVAARFPNLVCLGTTKDGHPRHPLYVRGDAPLVQFQHAAAAAGGARG